ncbi:MAG: hypothetical protein MJZ10_11455 [Fibrobacter sp.]|nr:hypothetical protein [Fibrobacter sp.]
MKNLLICVSFVALLFLVACSYEERVIDRFNSVEFVTLVDDTTGLLLVESNEKVEFYSSYISGMDERTDVVGRKYVYVDMREEKIYKEVDYPLSTPMNWVVISDSLLLFYWYYGKNGRSELTKASAWNYHSNVLENWSVVSRETLPTNVVKGGASIRSDNYYVRKGYANWGNGQISMAEYVNYECSDVMQDERGLYCLQIKDCYMMVLDSEGDIVDSLHVGDEHYVFFKGRYIYNGKIWGLYDGENVSLHYLYDIEHSDSGNLKITDGVGNSFIYESDKL